MTINTTRRAILAGAAAAPLAALPVTAAEPESPALALFREWRAIYPAFYAQSAISDEDEPLDRILDIATDLERRIVALPSNTPHTAAVIVAFLLRELDAGQLGGEWYEGGAVWAMAAAMLPSMPAEVAAFVAPMLETSRARLESDADEEGGAA